MKLLHIHNATPFSSAEGQRGRAQHLLSESSPSAASHPLSHVSKPDKQTSCVSHTADMKTLIKLLLSDSVSLVGV